MGKVRYIIIESLIFILAALSYLKSPDDKTWIILLTMCVGTSILLIFQGKIQERQDRKGRKLFFARKYPTFAGNVSILLQSGMSPKSAFLFLSNRPAKKEDLLGKELEVLRIKLNSGYRESVAYKEFGEACLGKEYRRLMSLVTQYLEQGTKFLIVLLEVEMREANKAKIRIARQEGEELSSKMLLPMGLLLFDVVILVIAPIISSLSSLQTL